MQVTGCKLQDASCKFSRLTFIFSPFTTHLSPLTSHPSPFTLHPSLLTSHLSRLTTHYSPFTTHNSQLTTSPSPPIFCITLTMLNLFITGCIITCIVLPIYGVQCQTTRYKDLVFKNIKIDNNVVYQPNPPEGAKKKYYLFDLYQPENDTCTSRPLILWMHGGGFKFGNKTSRGTPIWSKRFAQRGYVCAAVNYRLSKKNTLSDFSALVNACSDAIEDINQAITFFKKNHLLYKIDTNRIILAGNSAGGMIALQYVYSNPALMQQTGQAGIEKTLPAFNPAHIKTVINVWGAVFNLEC